VKPPKTDDGRTTVARNKKALHEYHIDERFEAGIALVGSEVKSIREGRANLVDAWAEVRAGELWLVGADFAPYAFAHARNHPPRRERKLLLHKREIQRLAGKVQEKGQTLIPLSLYLLRGRVKVELALAHGKREYDKRATKRRREIEREMDAEVSRRRR
jgi:SsrA-binding protein